MALASGHWVDKEIAGVPPSPRWVHSACRSLCNAIRRKINKISIIIIICRYGHAMTVAGNIAFLFGGASSAITEVCEFKKPLKTCSYFIKIIDSNIVPVQLFFILRMILQYIWMTFTWLQVTLVKYFAVNT